MRFIFGEINVCFVSFEFKKYNTVHSYYILLCYHKLTFPGVCVTLKVRTSYVTILSIFVEMHIFLLSANSVAFIIADNEPVCLN